MTDTTKGAALPAAAEWRKRALELADAIGTASNHMAHQAGSPAFFDRKDERDKARYQLRVLLESVPDAHPPAAAPAGLQQQIMDLANSGGGYVEEFARSAYNAGHRDARHAAASLVGGTPAGA